MPGLLFVKGPESEVGLEAEGKPSFKLSWLLWLLSVAPTVPISLTGTGRFLCPSWISYGF